MGEPIPSELDIFGLWFRLRDLEGDELEEAEARLEEWLRNKAKLRRIRHT